MLKKLRLKPWEIVVFVAIYLFMSFLYHLTLWLNRAGYNRENDFLFDLTEWFDSGGMQYLLMMVASALIWLIIFRLYEHWKLWSRLAIHLITLPIFILIATKVYYVFCGWLDLYHLEGSGQVWDVYIPTLWYLIQFSVFHAYEYYVINQRKIQYEIELKNAALKSELSAIKAQLNPHFLYNIFNTINASVPKEMEATREMIARLSDLFRYQLRASQEDFVPLRDELDFIRKYLWLEKQRFGERLQVFFTVSDELLDELIPPMILQPLVENSVKHGISPKIEGGEIRITISKSGERLHFEISDTGVGVSDKKEVFNKGVGVSNTQKRLEKIFNSRLILSDNIPEGLTIQFSL